MDKLRHLGFLFITGLPAIIAVVGSIVYFSYGLNKIGSLIAGVISLIIFFIILRQEYLHTETKPVNLLDIKKEEWIFFVSYTVLWTLSLYFLYKGRSDRPIITPWQVVSTWFFLFYALASTCLFILSRRSSKLILPSLILHSLLFFGVAAIVYKIGYGFDPFIHEAAIKAIEKLGQIIPLTPYYLGQYSLVTVAHTWLNINPALFAKILVPGMAALLIPILIFRWLVRHHGREKSWSLSAVALPALPATLFIITTPQNLGYLFLLIVIFLPSPKASYTEKLLVWLAAIAALFCQPIAGIPALAIAAIDFFENSKFKNNFYKIIIFGLALSLPLALYVFTNLSHSGNATMTFPNLTFLKDLLPENPNQENWWLNFIYLYKGLWPIVITLLTVSGAYLVFKNNLQEIKQRFFWPGIALLIAALISSCLNFHFLIDYERSDYAERIIITAFLIFLPLILISLNSWASRLEKADKKTAVLWGIIIVAASTASLYLSYPRFDHYYNSHGYATSKADIEAVEWIEKDANNKPYVVLANQQVSAAALHKYGFKNYYKNNIFYYPIPTGGELYKYYLEMVNKPDRSSVAKAIELTGVNKVYFVLNSYWWDYKKIAGEAAYISDKTKDIGSGQISIFVFSKD